MLQINFANISIFATPWHYHYGGTLFLKAAPAIFW